MNQSISQSEETSCERHALQTSSFCCPVQVTIEDGAGATTVSLHNPTQDHRPCWNSISNTKNLLKEEVAIREKGLYRYMRILSQCVLIIDYA